MYKKTKDNKLKNKTENNKKIITQQDTQIINNH